jgi:hypothetical protein
MPKEFGRGGGRHSAAQPGLVESASHSRETDATFAQPEGFWRGCHGICLGCGTLTSMSRSRRDRPGATARPRPTAAVRVTPVGQSGARESSAGDEFHYLWATQRALALLDPSSELRLVRIEGFSPTEPVSASADLLLGADLVEYYGGGELVTAERVLVSQLKYSTRRPDRAWTAARLSEANRPGGPSVVARLAELYRAVKGTHGRAVALKKLNLRLISNQPASARLRGAVAAAQGALGMDGRGASSSWIASLGGTWAAEIERLKKGAGLSDNGFADFVRVLDLSGCGAATREIEEAQLAVNVRKHFPGDPESAMNKLYRRIEKEGLPEAENSPGLTSDSILAMFGLDSPESLLPVPVKFVPVRNPVPTQDVAALARAVMAAAETKLVVHGDAGVGKTTTLTLLEGALPTGSIVIAYDCFGAGSYLDPAEGRHLAGQAALQLVNELATRCGTPFLLERSTAGPSLWRVLRDRIGEAAKGLRSDALLVLAIDAADNAALAAAAFGEQSFVRQIWHLGVPANVRLVVTARTHRLPSLQAPDDVPQVALEGFDPAASAAFLRQRFPQASDEACQTFHARSGGNPRVEFYVLDRSGQGDLALADVLSDADRTPGEIFDDLVRAGVQEASDPGRSTELIANLVAMARPTSLSTFAEASGIQGAEAERFCHGLAPGIRLSGDAVAFRDEDFELHLRGIVGADGERNAHRRLGQYFLAREQTEAEAAAVVAEHLFRGGELATLVQLAVTRGEPTAIADPIVRLHAYRRRLAFALRAALEEGARADAFRLTVLAGEAARSGSAVETVVRERADLAMRHGDPEGVAEIYLRQSNEPWRGPLHFRVAAMYARDGKAELSAEHLERARAWYLEARHHERSGGQEWRLSSEDIANGAEALFWNSGGLVAALRWLARWRPPEARFAALVSLADSLATRCPPARLLREVRSNRLQPRGEAAFLAALWNQGVRPSAERVRALGPQVVRALRRAPIEFGRVRYGRAEPVDEWGMQFAELAAASGADTEVVGSLLGRVAPALPEHAPSDWDGLAQHDLALRRLALQAALDGRDLTVDDFLPERLRPPGDASPNTYDRNESDRREFRERFGEVLPAYKVRARVVAKRSRVASVAAEIRRQVASRRSNAEHRWARSDVRFPIWASTITDALVRADGDAEPLLRKIAEVAELCVKGGAPDVWLAMARRVSRKAPLQELAKELADRAAGYAEGHEMPATERTSLLLSACAAVDWIDPGLAQDYYNRAVFAAAGIDDDSTKLLDPHARMMARLADSHRDSAAAIANRGIRLVESFKLRVSDEDRVPYVETLEAAAELHGPTAFAACSRWDDEGRVSFRSSVWPLVRGATASGFLPVRDGFWLLRLAGERHDIAGSAVRLLEGLRERGASARREIIGILDDVARWVERDQPFPARAAAARRIADWAQAAGFGDTSGPGRLRALGEYAASVGGRPADDDESYEWRSREAHHEDLPLARATDLADRLDELGSRYAGNAEFEEYTVNSGLALGPSARVAFLQALVGIPSTHRVMRWYAGAMASALGRLLAQWRTSTRVAAWAPEGIPRFVEEHFAGLVAFEEHARAALESVLILPFVVEPGALLLRGLASNLDGLSAGQLYAIASAVASSLSDQDLEEVLTWSMGRLEGEEPVPPTTGIADTADQTLADFFFAVFGSMDRKKRWRAAHGARSIVDRSRQGFVDALVEKSAKEEAGSFSSDGLPFYWISARQWLYLTLARIADEHPTVMERHLDLLIETATNREFPHAAIRDMAKQAALSIIRKRRIAMSDAGKRELEMANEPTQCFVERKYRGGRGDARRDREGRRFPFDSMDTLPYWFTPLGEVFAIGSEEVADRAETWIVDRLGFTKDDWWKDQRELSREGQWQDTHNDHGSIPVLETLRTYLEYHAMLLAAGEMVDSEAPVAYDEWTSDPSPWREWLARHVETFPQLWLADLRASAPLEPFVFAGIPPDDDWLALSDRDFDDQLILRSADGDRVALYAYLEMWAEDRRSHVRVHSAFVEPRTATSLLRALQTATDPHDWRLPGEDEGWRGDRFEIDEGELRLHGLLTEVREARAGLDEHDPLARIRYAFERPGVAFQRVTHSAPDPSGLKLVARDGSVVSETVLWNDEIGDERNRTVERHTGGRRTTIPLARLLEALRQLQLALVAEVEIERSIRDRENRGDDKYEPPPTIIYVLRETGVLETLERSRSLGRSDRARSGAR